MVDTPKTLQEAIQFYSDRAVCQAVLAAARWPNGVCCPHCGSLEVGYLKNQRRWQCREKHPRRQFSVKVGTIFEDSPLGLDQWFVALWLLASAKNGISTYELHRAIGVTQKTAWFMLHRLRLVMQTGSFEKMDGLGRIARVPKAEVEKEERKYQAARRRARQRHAADLSRRRSE